MIFLSDNVFRAKAGSCVRNKNLDCSWKIMLERKKKARAFVKPNDLRLIFFHPLSQSFIKNVNI